MKSKLPHIDFRKTETYSALQLDLKRISESNLKDLFKSNPNRFEKFNLQWEEILFDYSKNLLDEKTFNNLLKLAEECEIKSAIEALFSGEKINLTENRAVLHMALRAPKNDPLFENQKEIAQSVHSTLNRMYEISNAIHQGKWTGITGKKITDVVNIGIGGSNLGPNFVTQALMDFHEGPQVHFVTNLDQTDIASCLRNLNPETTLFLIASKTFSTQETMHNAKAAKKWFENSGFKGKNFLEKHFIALSSNSNQVKEFGIPEENMLEFWDWVGGRFSLWSAAGFSILLAIGEENFKALLEGAHKADQHFKNSELHENIPLIMGLLDIWYQNFLSCSSRAVIPYSHQLEQFPQYLQQLEMESNGKSINRNGEKIDYSTSGIIWGDSGINSQHAFFQLIHQGTSQLIPVEFIGYAEPTSDNSKESHHLLLANLLAQSNALLFGSNQDFTKYKEEGKDPHQYFEGNKPSTTLLLQKLNPENLGKLLALYEHRVFVQGIIWNILSFDQWGVELGKKLAKEIYLKLENPAYKESQIEMDNSTLGLLNWIHKK